MGLKLAHQATYNIVKTALEEAGYSSADVEISVGHRRQGRSNPEVNVHQSSFDTNQLLANDQQKFELSAVCYADTYVQACELADVIASRVNYLSSTNLTFDGSTFFVRTLDLFLDHNDRDSYEASVLIQLIESADFSSGETPQPVVSSSQPLAFLFQNTTDMQVLVSVSHTAENDVVNVGWKSWAQVGVTDQYVELPDAELFQVNARWHGADGTDFAGIIGDVLYSSASGSQTSNVITVDNNNHTIEFDPSQKTEYNDPNGTDSPTWDEIKKFVIYGTVINYDDVTEQFLQASFSFSVNTGN
jgi:hypothetical protein